MKKEYIPKYTRVKNDILNKISDGVLKKGDPIPTEFELAKQFGVSRITIVGALRELVEEGIIVKRRKKGSFIREDFPELEDFDIFSQIVSKPKTVITYALPGVKPDYEFLLKTLAGIFQLENPDICVRIENIPWPSKHSEDPLLLRLGSGTVPTAGEFFMHSTYAAMNALIPLDSLEGFRETVATIDPKCLYKTFNAEGEAHYHALVSGRNVRLVFVNTEFLAKAGVKDFDVAMTPELLCEWIEKASRYAEGRGEGEFGYFCETPSGWHNVIGLIQYFWQGISPGDYEAGNRECFLRLFSSPEGIAGLRFLQGLRRKYRSSPNNGFDLFAWGKIGILPAGNCWVLSLREMMANAIPVKAYPMPPLPGMDVFYPVQGSRCTGIFRAGIKSSGELEAVWRWIRFLFRKKQQYLLTMDYSLPSRMDCGCLLKKRYPDIFSVQKNAAEQARPQFDFNNVRTALSRTGDELNALFTGKFTPEECARRIMETV